MNKVNDAGVPKFYHEHFAYNELFPQSYHLTWAWLHIGWCGYRSASSHLKGVCILIPKVFFVFGPYPIFVNMLSLPTLRRSKNSLAFWAPRCVANLNRQSGWFVVRLLHSVYWACWYGGPLICGQPSSENPNVTIHGSLPRTYETEGSISLCAKCGSETFFRRNHWSRGYSHVLEDSWA